METLEQLKLRLAALATEYKSVIAKTTTPTPAPAGNVIKASVGEGGKNDAADVTIVQKLLNSKYKLGVSEDGKIGPKTIAAIKQFQEKVVKLSSPDGRIDPGGKSWQALSAGAAPGKETPPAPVVVTPTNGMITDSVGEGGKNVAADVAAVQTLFNKNHKKSFAIDGKAGAELIAAIKALQTAGGSTKPDGRIDPNGKTWGLLNKAAVAPVTPVEEKPFSNDPVVPGLVPTKGMITGSVGKGGKNEMADIAAVQQHLNTNHGGKFPVDGKISPALENAIVKLQESNGNSKPDGRIDPNGKTWAVLIVKPEPKPTPTPVGKMEKPNWLAVAEGETGVAEIVGKKHNPRVLEYHATTGGFKDDETPWCASFVTWVMKKAGVGGGFASAGAVAWANFGEKTETKIPGKAPIKDGKTPAYGAIAVFSYGGGKGHVGFVVGKKGNNILVLGGNQGNMVKVSAFAASKVHMYVVPAGYKIPAANYAFGESDGDFESADFNSTR